ncbi:MAG: dihydrofolate reductase family protein [Actinobacteria bacterium]|nr:dihydrofolate reductase family protein [Actinomycetota bacterium]
MTRVYAHISVSVDGYVDDAEGGLGWWSADEEFDEHIDGMLESIGGMVLGRVAYEGLARFWPAAGPEVSETQRRRMHELPKYILGHPREDLAWHNSKVLEGDPAAAIRAAADAAGDIAVFAGAGAVRSALTSGVLDELRLLVHPALVGSGTRLFGTGGPARPLRLLDERRFGSGVLVLRYDLDTAPAGSGR